jgi:dihydrofolate synthase/folylpolyglutamate synthase
MPSLDYREAVRALYGLQSFGVKLGLEKISSFLATLGNPHHTFTACHIAGTNGKGTCAAVVDAVLAAHGIQSGLYTSPHLLSMRERIRAGGRRVPEEYVTGWVSEHLDYIVRNRVTFFETVTAMAFDYFRLTKVEAAAVEVGLGGRYDATNVVAPAVAVITSIGLEHTRYLGRTIASIAREKAGIAKPGVPLLCGERKRSAVNVIAEVAGCAGGSLHFLDDSVSVRELKILPAGTRFSYRGPGLRLREAFVPLHGVHNLRNVALGLWAAELMLAGLGLAPQEEAFCQALEHLCWPARFQRLKVGHDLELVLDVAHNPAAAAKMRSLYRRMYGSQPALAVTALAGDKDHAKFIRHLLKMADRFIFPHVDFGRAESGSGGRDPENLKALVKRYSPLTAAHVSPHMEDALEQAFRLAAGRPVVVTGSFHTVGEAMRILKIKA